MFTENWRTVQVYQRCQWNVAVGAAGVIWTGIPTAEMREVCGALGLTLTTEILDGVRIMAAAAAPRRNQRHQQQRR